MTYVKEELKRVQPRANAPHPPVDPAFLLNLQYFMFPRLFPKVQLLAITHNILRGLNRKSERILHRRATAAPAGSV